MEGSTPDCAAICNDPDFTELHRLKSRFELTAFLVSSSGSSSGKFMPKVSLLAHQLANKKARNYGLFAGS